MKDILTSIKRTPYQSLTSFLILFFTLFLALFFFNMTSFFNGVLSYVETRPQVTVYFQGQVTEGEIFKIRNEIQATGKTQEIKYVSKAEALKIYKELNKNNPLLLEMVTAEILPPSLEVFASKPEYLTEIATYLKKQQGVDEVVFQQDIIEKLLGLTRAMRRISLFVFFFLIVISVVVLMTTTAFKIALKKNEISLLRLLGASTFYIRKPFLVEGIFFGLASATLSFIIFYLAYFYFSPFLRSYLAGIPQLPFYNLGPMGVYVWPPSLSFILLSYFVTVVFGVSIGLIGNFFSTSKYIK